MQNEEANAENGELADGRSPTGRTPHDSSERLLRFAVRAGKAVDALPRTRLGRHVAAQLIRSGTSAAPNYEEGCAAESRADFVHKLSICLKELRESRYWIRLIVESGLLSTKKMVELQDECAQLCKIVAQSLLTAKRNQHKREHGRP
jgi:four helix bundle protein